MPTQYKEPPKKSNHSGMRSLRRNWIICHWSFGDCLTLCQARTEKTGRRLNEETSNVALNAETSIRCVAICRGGRIIRFFPSLGISPFPLPFKADGCYCVCCPWRRMHRTTESLLFSSVSVTQAFRGSRKLRGTDEIFERSKRRTWLSHQFERDTVTGKWGLGEGSIEESVISKVLTKTCLWAAFLVEPYGSTVTPQRVRRHWE